MSCLGYFIADVAITVYIVAVFNYSSCQITFH